MKLKKTNLIGLNKKAKDTKIVVAMSGGVDSSTVAGIMKKSGFNVLGVTLKLYDDTKLANKKKRQCCAGQDIFDAKRVCQKLNIKHEILYYQKKFKKDVIDSFVDSYLAGETPIPCVKCNETVKFRDLFSYAKNLSADALITGHYIKRIQTQNKAEMYRATDLEKDQSYFLFTTTQNQLNFLRFPLGNMTKKETRNVAQELNLNVADKPESQDICFVNNGNYASVIKKFKPSSFKEGNIVNTKGKLIGKHEGIINYTIGQRKGIRISDKNPLYVLKINANKNEIIVGSKSELSIKTIYVKNLNLLDEIEKHNDSLFVKVRSTGKLIKANVKVESNQAKVKLEEEEQGISPGQACVFYSKNKIGDKILGGGWITDSN